MFEKVALGLVATVAIAACGATHQPAHHDPPSTAATTTTTSAAAQNASAIQTAQQQATSYQDIQGAFLRLPHAKMDDVGDPEYLAPGEPVSDISQDAGCQAIILDSPQAVALYRDAGDPVVTNPSGTVGAKVGGLPEFQAGCLQVAVRVLQQFK